MPIRRFLDGQAFEPEMITTMSEVLERVCAKLDLTMKDDPATRLVAAKIIELGSLSNIFIIQFRYLRF